MGKGGKKERGKGEGIKSNLNCEESWDEKGTEENDSKEEEEEEETGDKSLSPRAGCIEK